MALVPAIALLFLSVLLWPVLLWAQGRFNREPAHAAASPAGAVQHGRIDSPDGAAAGPDEGEPADPPSRHEPPAPNGATAAASGRATIRVCGRVLRSGLPVAGAELSFLSSRDAWRDRAVDWTITDARGGYEVELPVDCYLVEFQDLGVYGATVVVAPGTRELTFDFVLSP